MPATPDNTTLRFELELTADKLCEARLPGGGHDGCGSTGDRRSRFAIGRALAPLPEGPVRGHTG